MMLTDLAYELGPAIIAAADKLHDVTTYLNRKTAHLVVYVNHWYKVLYAETWPS